MNGSQRKCGEEDIQEMIFDATAILHKRLSELRDQIAEIQFKIDELDCDLLDQVRRINKLEDECYQKDLGEE